MQSNKMVRGKQLWVALLGASGEIALKLDYFVTLDDLVVFSLYHVQHSPFYRRQLLMGRIILPIIFLAGAVIFAGHSLAEPFEGWFVLPGLLALLAVFWLVWFPWFWKKNIVSTLKALDSEGPNPNWTGSFTLSLEPEEVIETNQYGRKSYRWLGIPKIEVSPSHIFIFIGSVHAIIIPADTFPDQESMQKFLGEARRLREAAVAQSSSGIQLHLPGRTSEKHP